MPVFFHCATETVNYTAIMPNRALILPPERRYVPRYIPTTPQ